jgi:hypothetical protein
VSPNGSYTDVDVSVDARLYGETDGRAVTVECRRQSDGSGGYRLTVEPSRGKFLLTRLGATTSGPLADWTYNDSIAVQNATNRIELQCQGDTIQALVNGDSLASVKDATFASGGVGIGTERFTNTTPRTVEARFKNLRVAFHPPAAPDAVGVCTAGRLPKFAMGFADLQSQIGASMGDPIECEHPNPANGDTLQRTSTGVALYRQRTNMATFSDGWTHWALTSDGLIQWVARVDPPFWQFAGGWTFHGFGMSVRADGQATATWRTYVSCDDPSASGACDSFVGHEIVDGGHATLVLDTHQGPMAQGRVLDSSDPNTIAPGSFQLVLDANGLGEFRQNGQTLNLCGPGYPALATAQVQQTFPCGA